MLFTTILTASALAASVVATPFAAPQTEFEIENEGFELARRQIPVLPCSSGVHVIAASGDGQANIGGYGLLGALATKVLKAIPDSTNVTLPYPKATSDVQVKVGNGVNNMYLYIKQYHAHCPNTRIALMGYSSGAMIVMNTLCGASYGFTPSGPLPSNWTSAIIAATAYGDETRQAGQSFNRGTCKNTAPYLGRQNGATGCAAWASRIRNWCNASDGYCCYGGLIPMTHFEYDQKNDDAAVQFFVNRYAATGGKNPTNPKPKGHD